MHAHSVIRTHTAATLAHTAFRRHEYCTCHQHALQASNAQLHKAGPLQIAETTLGFTAAVTTHQICAAPPVKMLPSGFVSTPTCTAFQKPMNLPPTQYSSLMLGRLLTAAAANSS
jgi:hypothetical protein